MDGQKLSRDIPFLEREQMIGGLADHIWSHNHVLQLIRPGAARSTWLLWSEHDWSLPAWYVNLRVPMQRTLIGFDTADYLLDIEVTPDLQWSWKDRDEVEGARRHGLAAPEILDRMEREGARAIRDVKDPAWPFNAGCEHWRPSPSWGTPTLPDGWDERLDRPFVPAF